MILRVDVLVVNIRFVERIGSGGSLRSRNSRRLSRKHSYSATTPNRRNAAQTGDAQGLAEATP
eukprot:3279346-Pleurochrysis_carterae.AAC.1